MKANNLVMLIFAFLFLMVLVPSNFTTYAQESFIKIYTDEDPPVESKSILGDRTNQHWINNYILWIFTNNDNVGTDTTTATIDSAGPYDGKYDIHCHICDAPNPRMELEFYDANYPSAHNPLDCSNTDKVTFWIKAASTAEPLWLWFEDATYPSPAGIGQTGQITIDGESIFSNGKVQSFKPFNGQWQFVSLPWSLILSRDTAFVSHTFNGSRTDSIHQMDYHYLRKMIFDSDVITLIKRGPYGQGPISDYYIDDVFYVKDTVTSVTGEKSVVPTLFSLYQNYPNPFNPSTNIKYDLPTYATVTLKIYNLLGQVVRTLVNNQFQNPGTYTITWNGKDNEGNLLPSGQYLYQIQAGHFTSTRKMILLK